MTQEEFENIAPSLRDLMYSVAHDFFGNQDDAEDVAQDGMREFYCVCWKKSGNVFNGYVYLIYSKRPDLIADEEEREEQNKAQSMADIMPAGTAAQKMAVLERLSKQYQDEIYRLSKETTNPLYNQSSTTIGVRSELMNQIRDYRSKLQEVLAEMQAIVEEM